MTFLTIISRIHPWTPWPIIRIVINFLLAIGVGLVALLYYNSDRALNYLFSPWVLPTIALVWAIVLVLTHIHNPPPLFFRQSAMSARGAKQHEYGQVEVALAEDANITRKPIGGDNGVI